MTEPKKTVIEFPSVSDQAYKESRRHLKVDDIMSRKVITTTPETTMMQAAMTMGEKHIGSIIVTKYKTPVAIVTERDLLSRVIATGMDLRKTLVGDIMSYPLIKICPTLEIREAARTMINRKGRLVVHECANLLDYHSVRPDRGMPEARTSMVVDDFMTRRSSASMKMRPFLPQPENMDSSGLAA
jgi:predicted transcriptional regulator